MGAVTARKLNSHRWPVVRPLEDLPPHVNMLCEVGDHDRCPGRVALPEVKDGRAYVRCACPAPECNHPEITTIKIKY